MSETVSDNAFIDVEPMSVDQLAGAFVMIAGAIGSLLLVIWQSKCHCKMNLCYIFSCERRPPNEEEMKSLKDQAKDMKKKTDKLVKKEDDLESQKSLSRSNSKPEEGDAKIELETINLDSSPKP
jgi:hypothetical protein